MCCPTGCADHMFMFLLESASKWNIIVNILSFTLAHIIINIQIRCTFHDELHLMVFKITFQTTFPLPLRPP